jgi:hypothetical protein
MNMFEFDFNLASAALGVVIGGLAALVFWMLDRSKFESVATEAKTRADMLKEQADETLDQLMAVFDELDNEVAHSEALQLELHEVATTRTRKAAGTAATKAVEPTTRKRSSK